jgi:5-(carboxyamino)imidazole ribonucleotide mutase
MNMVLEANQLPKVAVIMGSDSDFPALEKGIALLKDFGVEVEVMVCSAHRTPERAAKFARNAASNGFGAIIAAAGKSAHLAGVMAASTTLPVIGIPIKSSFMDGLDSLLSIVQMPDGVPVATVGINSSTNAALLAVQMIGIYNSDISMKLSEYKKNMEANVIKMNAKLQEKLI